MSGHILGLSQDVERRTVVYKNRYGLEISGELYMEKDVDAEKLPALVIGAP